MVMVLYDLWGYEDVYFGFLSFSACWCYTMAFVFEFCGVCYFYCTIFMCILFSSNVLFLNKRGECWALQ